MEYMYPNFDPASISAVRLLLNPNASIPQSVSRDDVHGKAVAIADVWRELDTERHTLEHGNIICVYTHMLT